MDGATTYYYYADGKLLKEICGSSTLDFFYDENGYPYAMKDSSGVYYYITNLQGDVMRMVDAQGNTVASYEYDPYGNILSATGSKASTNPLRYRGYYYDEELRMYYLQSRYYDPAIGRFINADVYASTGQGVLGHNMYAYCSNRPVSNADIEGEYYVSVVTSVSTKVISTSRRGKSYSTKIWYYTVDIQTYDSWLWPTYSNATFTYFISNGGIITFDNEQSYAGTVVLDTIVTRRLASEMMKQARKQVPGSLKGRTAKGIALELAAHCGGMMLGIRTEKTKITHIGSNKRGSIGYDDNADWFENPMRHIFTIIRAMC